MLINDRTSEQRSPAATSPGPGGAEPNRELLRARRLFEFLTRAQELKAAPVRDTSSYEHVLWLADLPRHSAAQIATLSNHPEVDDPVLSLIRVERRSPPITPDICAPWLDFDPASSSAVPGLVDVLRAGRGVPAPTDPDDPEVRRADHPAVQRAYDAWLPSWTAWSVRDREEIRLQRAYEGLFNAYVKATSRSEEFEVVLGVVCLAWQPAGQPAVRRHLLTSPLRLELDGESGALNATVDPGLGLSLEIDMLDPGTLPRTFSIQDHRSSALELRAHPLDRAAVDALGRQLCHSLGPNGRYDDALGRLSPGQAPTASFAPAIVLRSRSSRGLIEVFRTIKAQLDQADSVPSGLRPLVDPDYRAPVQTDPRPGGILMVGNDPFLALPVNARQQQVVANVDAHAQTLVQGPPGTGKTHTAAALLTHLLAQGKRVLVTAHTDRALHEVRGKLPAAIRPLAVSVLGGSRSDLADLKTAVERISTAAADYDPVQLSAEATTALEQVDELHRERAWTFARLRDAREKETTARTHMSYTGTLAAIAQQVQTEGERFGWLRTYVEPSPSSRSPLTAGEASDWLDLLRDQDVRRHEPEAVRDWPPPATLPDPAKVHRLVEAEQQARAGQQVWTALRGHRAYDAVARLSHDERDQLRDRFRQLGRRVADLEQREETWTNDALRDIRTGRGSAWVARAKSVWELLAQAEPLVASVHPTTRIEWSQGDPAQHRQQAEALLNHLSQGAVLKLDAAGRVRIGPLAPRPVKQAAALLTDVRINRLPPTTPEQLRQLLAWHAADDVLDALDRAWPAEVAILREDTLAERLQWHRTELEQLDRLLRFASELDEAGHHLNRLGLPRPDWSALADIEAYAQVVDAAAAADNLTAATRPLLDTEQTLRTFLATRKPAAVVFRLAAALENRDVGGYRSAHTELLNLARVRQRLDRRRQLGDALNAVAPRLRAAVEETSGNSDWPQRLRALPLAWSWAATAAWVVDQEQVDVNRLQAALNRVEAGIRTQVERLAAARAWQHAASPTRLTGTARADLTQYVQLVRKLGRGTGKYAPAQRAEVRSALQRCSPAVPVWIMPIYRIGEQLTIRENLFDVVLVDEASQAGTEATFLQYLAPKIVVIGDDKQVSPTAVGVDQQQLRDLADQYLEDDRYKASWQDPQRSLFDEARMRYGDLITLTEHRRCVPEIIEFSNRIAYEPDGIRLNPVRQYGSDRLEPIVPVLVTDGYEQGSSGHKVNEPECEALIAQIEKCIADPRYDGRTFGVISLLGAAQARRIESQLLGRIPPEELAARDLRCGDAADFQGSERDVIFLSMVAAPGEGRLAALTRDLYVQRYNVAVSRAKDQLWLFHSLQLRDLTNPEDLRYRLLEYCYEVAHRSRTAGLHSVPEPVPDDEKVEPFDSLFEQRVFNRLVARGYRVLPQQDAEGYRIDLVVVGSRGRLAVECDGDRWHGPDRYQADLGRQRDLERAGWQFFRVRESGFYLDREGMLQQLWDRLDALDIRPVGWQHDPVHVERAERPPRPLTVGEVAEAPIEADRSEADRPNAERPEAERPEAERSEAERSELVSIEPEPAAHESAVHREPESDGALPPYQGYSGHLPHPLEASSTDVLRGLLDVVAVEGPVVRQRLFDAYVAASDAQRLGKNIVDSLGQALGRGVRSGHLIAEGRGQRVAYRLPAQPPVRRRQIGLRRLEDVPPAELAALVSDAAAEHGWSNPEALFREALSRLGLRRLTTDAARLMVSALAQAKEHL